MIFVSDLGDSISISTWPYADFSWGTPWLCLSVFVRGTSLRVYTGLYFRYAQPLALFCVANPAVRNCKIFVRYYRVNVL
jgi:hypothetical protein